jgi:hypothetical protein
MRRPGSWVSNAIYPGRSSSPQLTSASKAHEVCSSSCPTPTPSEQSAPVQTARRGLSTRLRAVTPRANRASCNCAAGCAAASPRRCSTLIRSRLTMTRAWAARVTSSPATRARRPPEGQGQSSGQGSGQGSGGNNGHHHAKRIDHTGHRAELAQPACRAFPFLLRSTSPAQPAGPIHQRRRPGRRNPHGRLARQAAQGVDCSDHGRRRHRPAGDAGLLGGRPRNRLHRHHSPRPYRRSHYHVPRRSAPQPRRLHAPLPGQWGTAGRNSITGPGQFSLDTSVARTFRPSGRFYLDLKVAATNMLNHPVFTGWNTTVNSTQFGLPLNPNAMRSLQTSLRLRF